MSTKNKPLYAWLVDEGDGHEGIIGASTGGLLMQLVTVNKALIPLYDEIAKQHSAASGHPVRRVKCSTFEEDEQL